MRATQHLTLLLALAGTLLLSGCSQLPDLGSVFNDPMEATVVYYTLSGERRIARITPHSVISDRHISEDEDIPLMQAGRPLIPLSFRADGIYAENLTGEPVHLVQGHNLTDPVMAVTPAPDLHILSYIALQGRKPVLKLRTIENGTVSARGVVLPLAADIDSYSISDFVYREAP